MSYNSIDAMQKILAEQVFSYTKDAKKASGRALGTFVEIITFYLLKSWNLKNNLAIERALPEYANTEITHNVEFTLHPAAFLKNIEVYLEKSITSNFLCKTLELNNDVHKKNTSLYTSSINSIKNACTIYENDTSFINAYIDNDLKEKNKYYVSLYKLSAKPLAMIECKRVGIEEGMRKGPQTIEKAKQAAYVANNVSALQKIRNNDGTFSGIVQTSKGFQIDSYDKLLRQAIENKNISDFVLTVGIVSNHGNWFSADNMNKELKVLSQSYDWLLFLTDEGLTQFIQDLILSPNQKYILVKNAFLEAYNNGSNKRYFTKSFLPLKADELLTYYFSSNIKKIEKWFNIISPSRCTIKDLKDDLLKLVKL